MKPLAGREPSLDAVRALAILMVLTTHASSQGVTLPPGGLDWWSALLWSGLAKAGVPLFFMCSGALMLSRDLPLKRLYGHNMLRIITAMLTWAFLYKVVHLWTAGGITLSGLWQSAKEVLLLNQEFHLYYLHILLLVYAFLPVARVFVRHASRREMEYALGFWAVTGILFPLLQFFWPFTLVYTMNTAWYVMNMTYSAIGYCLLGVYLRQYGGKGHTPRGRIIYTVSLASGAAITLLGTAALSLRNGQYSGTFMEGMSPGPMLMAFGIMGLLLTKENWPDGLRRFTGSLSQASFCIYLSHILVLHICERLGLTSAILPMVTIPAQVVLMAAVCWALYQLLSRVPLVNRWLI